MRRPDRAIRSRPYRPASSKLYKARSPPRDCRRPLRRTTARWRRSAPSRRAPSSASSDPLSSAAGSGVHHMLTRLLSIPTALLASAALLLGAAPWSARADDGSSSDAADSAAAHPNQFRLGMYYIHSAVSADDLSGPFVPPGLNLRVKDMYTPYFAYVRRLSPHFELELAAGWPPLAKTIARGPAYLGSVPYNGQEISTARWFGPTLL